MADNPNIQDLISASAGQAVDESASAKFEEKNKIIAVHEMEHYTQNKAADLGVPYLDLSAFPIGPEALSLMTEDEARALQAVCFYFDGKNLRLAAVEPQNEAVLAKLEALKKQAYAESGDIYIVSPHSLEHALYLYRTLPKFKPQPKGISLTEESLNQYSEKIASFLDLQKQINSTSVSDVLTVITAAAVKSGASDAHIEPEEKEIAVRFRLDGLLYQVATLDKTMWPKIISRLKVLAGVKINITDHPQDGRISINMANDKIDIRASFLPTNYGESVVMRFLRASVAGIGMEELGIRPRFFEILKHEIERPNGMIITTGPTGSGKTTTLYAILQKLNSKETKIVTVEDPIEYRLPGISQSQTNEKYTFAQALRSIVRQDPDIIMIGEIRDLETAEISIQAALTGHLVLSTVHTNDAAGTIPRLLSMGAKPFLLAPAINAMIGQRLVRKICTNCKEETTLTPESFGQVKTILEKLPEEEKKQIDLNNLKFYHGKGCEVCQTLGYKGRVGIYEIMTMNPEIEKVILAGSASEYDLRDIAAEHGVVNMIQDGLLKAVEGLTTVEEVFRVAGSGETGA